MKRITIEIDEVEFARIKAFCAAFEISENHLITSALESETFWDTDYEYMVGAEDQKAMHRVYNKVFLKTLKRCGLELTEVGKENHLFKV